MRKTEAPGHQNNRFVDRNPPGVPIGTRITADTMNDLQDELMGIQDEANLPEATGSQKQVLKAIREIVYPVGYTYAQYPSGKTPGEMKFPGVWVSQFETEGVFFRTPGGNASSFSSGVQQDAFQAHAIKAKSVYGNSAGTLRGWSSHNGVHVEDSALPSSTYGSSFAPYGTNGTPRTANETRPKNRTFRIWRRTA